MAIRAPFLGAWPCFSPRPAWSASPPKDSVGWSPTYFSCNATVGACVGTCAVTGCAQGPARWYYVVVGTRKFGRAWVSTEGAKATAARAAAINVTDSAKKQSASQADSRSAAATAAGAASVTAA